MRGTSPSPSASHSRSRSITRPDDARSADASWSLIGGASGPSSRSMSPSSPFRAFGFGGSALAGGGTAASFFRAASSSRCSFATSSLSVTPSSRAAVRLARADAKSSSRPAALCSLTLAEPSCCLRPRSSPSSALRPETSPAY